MGGLSSTEQAIVESAGAEPMLDQVLEWSAVNSGSRNIDGLGRMSALLGDAFSALPGSVVLVDAEPVLLHCVLPVPVAQERVAGRYGPSDADAEVVARGAERFAPWPDALTIDTRAGPEACVEKAVATVAHARPG